jgi:hypothetical protein
MRILQQNMNIMQKQQEWHLILAYYSINSILCNYRSVPDQNCSLRRKFGSKIFKTTTTTTANKKQSKAKKEVATK